MNIIFFDYTYVFTYVGTSISLLWVFYFIKLIMRGASGPISNGEEHVKNVPVASGSILIRAANGPATSGPYSLIYLKSNNFHNRKF